MNTAPKTTTEARLLEVCMSLQPLLRGLAEDARLSLTEQMAINRLEQAIEPVYDEWAEHQNRRAA